MYFARRSYTPGGSTVTLQVRGGQSDSTGQVYDDGLLQWLVVGN